jgi:hypothetical protein
MNKQQLIARYDFAGDASLHQLSFVRNSVIDVKLEQRPKNGWLWGSCRGERGWFPAWVIAYDEVQGKDIHGKHLGMESNPAMLQTHTPQDNFSYPIQLSTSICLAEKSSGFDQATNEIMGGNITPQVEERNESSGDNPFHAPSDQKDPSSLAKSHGTFFSRFRKPKVNPFSFQQEKAKTPEWTPVPQIIYEGKVIQEPELNKKGGLFRHLHLG